MAYTQNVGNLGERLACDYLKKKNYEIIRTNYHGPSGEIDIIARVVQEVDWLVFIEVKSQTNPDVELFGHPEELVDYSKERKIVATANHYLDKFNLNPLHWRLDVIAININPETRKAQIKHYENIWFDKTSSQRLVSLWLNKLINNLSTLPTLDPTQVLI